MGSMFDDEEVVEEVGRRFQMLVEFMIKNGWNSTPRDTIVSTVALRLLMKSQSEVLEAAGIQVVEMSQVQIPQICMN